MANVVSASQVGPASTAHKRSAIPSASMEPVLLQMFVSAIRVGKASFVKSECAPYVSMGFVQPPNSASASMDTKGRAATYQSACHPVTTESLFKQMFVSAIPASKEEYVISQSVTWTVAPKVIASLQTHVSVTSVGKAATPVHLAI